MALKQFPILIWEANGEQPLILTLICDRVGEAKLERFLNRFCDVKKKHPWLFRNAGVDIHNPAFLAKKVSE